ncbi:SNF1-related protein kinase regulatory subunit beta-1-like [Zingiber officinale]|uniref:SNF1-related protein kinase regulatory subunit beta-1-like n=1 Tax=Zingiber officinale TaxID=94328 RepID=UPI001C4D80B3|nr:SNF1-related protein kinase regulatory subunit beta-1-like [Zingiber officinale]XP_042384696.1 SNF1-related protein kinase regulatory subunit beta-1-like [Zingiber officinale]XP_042384705.1 SNF1-related protein kinase regulatory subunit beta-1-like [Zingiber officinale]
MGNASVKEGENGNGGFAEGSEDRDSGTGSDLQTQMDQMGLSQPESPRMTRSPLMFAPQIPLTPLQRAGDGPLVFNHTQMDHSDGTLDVPPENGIPTLITWSLGGNEILVEGSWDNWTSRKTMQLSGKDYSTLLVLPSGVYHYKFIVDGELRYIPNLPHMTNANGQTVNILDVSEYVPEILEGVSEFEAPPSPHSSYGVSLPVDEDFTKEPPALPSQLQLTVLGSQDAEESSLKPQHVVLNHVFIEKGRASQSLVAVGLTHRFQSKYVTMVLYKPMRRQE